MQDHLDSKPTLNDIFGDALSPGLRGHETGWYDYPVVRDKSDNFEPMEIVISAIVGGCIFGK